MLGMKRRRIFLLSPAHCGGERAKIVLRDQAQFELALKLRTPMGAPLGEVFSFLSGLYFRGKLAYARAFARPPRGVEGALVITTNRGLLAADTNITLDELRAMGGGCIDPADARYREPLARSARALCGKLKGECDVVLLGSVASGKYVEILAEIFGERLKFPQEFIGRGDMSRGGLMLRSVDTTTELTYIPIAGAARRGARPPKLAPRVSLRARDFIASRKLM